MSIGIEAYDIRHSFSAGHAVLKGITLSLAPGSLTGLIGPSGSGKSVLLKILAGVMSPNHGEVRFTDGVTINQEESKILASDRISLMFQEGALFDSLTVFDNVAFPLVSGRVPAMILPPAERERVHEAVSRVLARVGLAKASQKMPAQLSGGMRRRVSLARALVVRPSILLLDDPTSGLDPVASGVIMNLIRELHSEYRPTTILVSQDLRRLLPAVEEVVALFDGRIVFCGNLGALTHDAAPDVRYFVSCRYG